MSFCCGGTEESNQLRLDVSSNPGYAESEGLPSTPPPTYSMIERQTSYVSQISMSSSQGESYRSACLVVMVSHTDQHV